MDSQQNQINDLSETITHVEFSERTIDPSITEEDYPLQTGGISHGTTELTNYEQDFHAIFNKANEYKKRVSGLTGGYYRDTTELINYEKDFYTLFNESKKHNSGLIGGENGTKKKRPSSQTFQALQEITKKLQDTYGPKFKQEGLQRKDLVGIASLILKAARKKAGTTEINDNVMNITNGLIKSSINEFVVDYHKNQADKAKVKLNTSTKLIKKYARSNRF